MDWTIEYIEHLGIVKVNTKGIFTIEDHRQMIEDIISQEFWKPGLHTFFDNRKLDFQNTTIPFMKKVSANYQDYKDQIGSGKAALLMKSLADFARGRQLELMTENHVLAKMNVFLDEKETIEWLTT